VNEGLQVLVYAPDQTDLFARICGYFDQGGFSIQDARIHTARNGYAVDTFQLVSPICTEHYREISAMVESELARYVADGGRCPSPAGAGSRAASRVFLCATHLTQARRQGQRWLLSITASDQPGLLYKVARVLAGHRINLQLAKINTLGERVDDVFLVDGPELQNNRAQIAIETELLDVLAS
jgi:[protein-PII] uridylyltransferase